MGGAFCLPATQQSLPGFRIADTAREAWFDTDLAALKNVKISERLSMEFRAEFFNAFNNVNFGRPDGNLADIGTTYGEITGLAGGSSSNTYGTAQPRIIQFGLKLAF